MDIPLDITVVITEGQKTDPPSPSLSMIEHLCLLYRSMFVYVLKNRSKFNVLIRQLPGSEPAKQIFMTLHLSLDGKK